MSLNNWSYEEANSILDSIQEQKNLLINIKENFEEEENKIDPRVLEYIENVSGINNTKNEIASLEEKIDAYIDWLKTTNEAAKAIEDSNYQSLDNINSPSISTNPPDYNNPIYSGGSNSSSGSYTNTNTNITTGGNNTSTGGYTKISTTEPPTPIENNNGASSGAAIGGAGAVVTTISTIITEPPTEKPTETQTEAPTEAPTEQTTEVETEPVKEEDENINGATGYSALNNKQYLHESPNKASASICPIPWGEPFKIISSNENDTWWKVEYNGQKGYLENKYCLINLPDFIPSIQYNITNASSSIFVSSGQPLSVNGQQLYTSGKVYNARLDRNEYIVPLSYTFAKKILAVQTAAMAAGYSLKIYDAYRPKSVAITVRDSLQALYNSSSTVKKNIDVHPGNGSIWGTAWFIASNLSAHSLACAIDVTMVNNATGQEISTPSAMHELSTQAVKYIYGVKGQTSVQENLYVAELGEECRLMDKLMVNNGLTNLASEWWHFQDNSSYNTIAGWEPGGLDFQPTKIVSTKSSIKKSD